MEIQSSIHLNMRQDWSDIGSATTWSVYSKDQWFTETILKKQEILKLRQSFVNQYWFEGSYWNLPNQKFCNSLNDVRDIFYGANTSELVINQV